MSGGNARRITLPSFDGVTPMSLAWMAFSIAGIDVLSNGVIIRSRGSGTEIDASWFSGTGEP